MKKKLIGILAVASAAALLLGGAYLLTKDDIAQKNAEEELQPFMPSGGSISPIQASTIRSCRDRTMISISHTARTVAV